MYFAAGKLQAQVLKFDTAEWPFSGVSKFESRLKFRLVVSEWCAVYNEHFFVRSAVPCFVERNGSSPCHEKQV